MTEYANIRFDVSEQVGTIELHRPHAMNAFTHAMLTDLLDALDRVDNDDEIRAVIVTGAGDRAFCAGADLSLGAATFSEEKLRHRAVAGAGSVPRDSGGLAAMRLYRCRKPVIAAINGVAVGVGATMTLPMDIRLASTTARFGFVFARRGLVPEAASSWFLPRLVGIDRALEWCYTGHLFGAEEALDAGLVRSVHEPDQLLDAARAIAVEIARSTSAVSITLTRQMLWRMLSAAHPMDAHRIDSRALFELGKSADVREGVNSFLEKRSAHFTDRSSTDVPDVFVDWDEPEFS